MCGWQRAHDAALGPFERGARVLWLSAPDVDGASALALVQLRPGQRDYRHAWIDPSSCALRGTAPFRTIPRTLRDLHRALLFGEDAGLFVVTTLTFVLALSLWSGLTITGPLRRALRHPPRTLGLAHRTMGLALLPFVVLLVVTGGWYWGELVLGWADVSVEPDVPRMSDGGCARLERGEQVRALDQLVDDARAALPGLEVHFVSLATARRPVITVSGATRALLVRDAASTVYLDAYDGSTLGVVRPDRMGPIERWSHTVDLLHFGSFAGAPSKALWALGGTAMTALAVTGLVAHRRRRRRHRAAISDRRS